MATSPAPDVATDRSDQPRNLLVRVAGLDGRLDTSVDVIGQDEHRDRIKRSVDSRELVEHVDAVAAVGVHRGDARQLAVCLVQPRQDLGPLACAAEQTLRRSWSPRGSSGGVALGAQLCDLPLQVDDALARISITLRWLLVLRRFTVLSTHFVAAPHAAHAAHAAS